MSRSGAALIAEETRVELRDGSARPTPTIDLEDDRAVAATFVGDSAFVIVTARGRTIRLTTERVNRAG